MLKQPKVLPSHSAVECQTMKVHHMPTNSFKTIFCDWCRNEYEFGSSKIYLYMFCSIYHDWWTLAEAAKNAALSHCCWVPNYEDAPTTTKLLQTNFPEWHRNVFGSNEKILIHVYQHLWWLNTSWSSQKCCPATVLLIAKKSRNEDASSMHHKTSANKPSLTGVGMSLDQVKYTYPCLPAFIMTEHWLK